MAKSVVEDICNVNRLVKSVPNNIPIKIKSKGIKPQDIGFLSVSDIVWANADKFCSQVGYMIVVVNKKIMRYIFTKMEKLQTKQEDTLHTGGRTILSRSLAKTRWMKNI